MKMSSQLVSLIINIVTLFSYVKEMITTTSPISWPPLTSMAYITEHTDNDYIIKRCEQFEPGINSFANDCIIIYKIFLLVLFSIPFS